MTIRAGISIPRLQRWDAHVQQTYLDSGLLPNAQTLVYRRGELAYQSVLGFADMGPARRCARTICFASIP
ncbi:hypothetical protein MSS93_15760 [Deinococcus radiodurans]|nr:hypothetical protein MSS93_15760 [Deinococcus radiodurans]